MGSFGFYAKKFESKTISKPIHFGWGAFHFGIRIWKLNGIMRNYLINFNWEYGDEHGAETKTKLTSRMCAGRDRECVVELWAVWEDPKSYEWKRFHLLLFIPWMMLQPPFLECARTVVMNKRSGSSKRGPGLEARRIKNVEKCKFSLFTTWR